MNTKTTMMTSATMMESMTMTNAPERIWACMGGPMVGLFVSGGNNGGWPEYVRADMVQSQILRAVALERAIWIKAIENCFDPSALNDIEPIVEKYRAAVAKEAGK